MNWSKVLNKEKIIFFILIVIIIFNVFLTISTNNLRNEYKTYIENAVKNTKSNFTLLSPAISELSVEEFLRVRQSFTTSYLSLKPILNKTITENVSGEFGLYFEDLTTGAWLGLNEKEEFLPASLIKVTIMVAILKKVEVGKLGLEDRLVISKRNLDSKSGTLYLRREGTNLTIDELLNYMIKESDNTAAKTLMEIITPEEYNDVLAAVGFDSLLLEDVSPKDYSNLLRSLYYSTYLRRVFSEMALSIMSDTEFNSQISQGVSKDINVAHKVGYYFDGGYYHDCGIIYYPNNPYILCIMSKNSTQEESNVIMKEVSKIIYDFKSEKD